IRVLFRCRERAALRHRAGVADRIGQIAEQRHVRPAAESAALFRDLPDTIRNTRAVAERCAFTLEDLGYEFPDPHLQYSTTLDGELWHRTLDGARTRYGGPTSARWPKAVAQIERELSLIAKLGLAGYFLIVHDLVQF